MVQLLLFGVLAISLALTVPIGLSLGLAAAAAILYSFPGTPMMGMLAQSMVTSIDSFPLMAIPFFMMLGILMEKGGLAQKLVDVGSACSGATPGGLGNAAIVSAMFFSTISGSGPAVVAAIGAIMIPAMKQRGYPPEYSAALVASASVAGPILPPSIPMIIYGATIGVSIIRLFTAGIVPGIIMFVAMAGMNYLISKQRGYVGVPREGGITWILKKCGSAFWALLMPVVVLGGIYGGFFTPTEAAVVGVIYALLVSVFVYRALTLRGFFDSLLQATLLSAIVMVVMGSATTFGRVLTIERIPEMLANAILTVTDNPILIMIMINVILLVIGMFIDPISAIILLAPLLTPIALVAGYDTTSFGLIMIINVCIGFITPPLAVGIFVAQGIAGVSFEAILKNVWPYLLTLLGVLIIFIIFPQIITFLPDMLGM